MSKEDIPNIEVLYEDADMAAVNKPAGLMVHPDGRNEGPFLTDWVATKFPQAVEVGEDSRTPEGEVIERPGIVHRLDKDTSGVILIAKTKEGHKALKKQFQERTIVKKYAAFVWGMMEEEFGTIDRPIGRSSEFPKWSAQRGARGELREANTYWTKIKDFECLVEDEKQKATLLRSVGAMEGRGSKKEKFTLVEAEPKTGRTHQIRVHFAAVQHPVVGDSLYASKKPMALGFNRCALHAKSIEFENVEGKRIRIEAPLPEDFKKACEEVGIKG